MLNDINNPALVKEWKLNLDAAVNEKKYVKVNILSYKNKLIVMIAKRTSQYASKKRFSGFLSSPIWSIL